MTLATSLFATFYEGYSAFTAGADYYFKKMTSLGGTWSDSDDVTIEINHYFNTHFSLRLS